MRLSLLPALAVTICVAALVPRARAADMVFSTVPYVDGGGGGSCLSDCPRIMQAVGPITTATPKAFLEFARREIGKPGLINILLIHSPGGSVNSSIAFGRILRKLGAVVVVARAMDVGQIPRATAGRRDQGLSANLRFMSGTCASACVYALAGGAKRVVPPESRIAVHRMAGNIGHFDPATREYENRQVYAGATELDALTSYIHDMGVSTDLVDIAESVPHENALVLTSKEIRKLGLAAPSL